MGVEQPKRRLGVCGVSAEIIHGTCPDALRQYDDATFDAVVTDPPYELGFMGKAWDASGIAYSVDLWREVLRVVKPGGHLLAFGGTRTWHRMVCAIEDAGFEIRDELAWLYGSGFPKSLDVSKAIDKAAGAEREVVGSKAVTRIMDGSELVGGVVRSGVVDITAPATPEAERWNGWGTAIKPAHEPICLARKPLVGTVAENVLTHGTGALNIDACRVGTTVETWPTSRGPNTGTSMAGGVMARTETGEAPSGRWPANVVLDDEAARLLDQQSGTWQSKPGIQPAMGRSGGILGEASPRPDAGQPMGYSDSGGASRFFYVAKAAKHERPRLDDGTAHATVKPVALMRWLVRLITPPGGLVLDPFAGSGTTGEACIAEGFRCVLIEQDEAHVQLIRQRLAKPIQTGLGL